jgi:hypothetical protein
MSNEDVYFENEEYKEYQRLINSVERLTQSEYELCKLWNPEEAWRFLNDIGNGRWLNINVYSEVDKEAYDLQREMGY